MLRREDGLLNLNGNASDGLDGTDNSLITDSLITDSLINDGRDNRNSSGAHNNNRCCWGRFHVPRAKHVLVGLASIAVLLNTVLLIQLSTISYALVQVQQKLPDTIADYTDDIMGRAETLIEEQIDGVVEDVGNSVKTAIYDDIENVFIPEMITRIKSILYGEFGGEAQFRAMVEKLEKLTAYACSKYPTVCDSTNMDNG